MRDPSKVVAVGSAALAAIGVAVLVTKRESAAPATPRRVALIGDSYAVGLGPQLEGMLPNLKYEGHVGTNTSQWANHAAACGQCGDWLTAYQPDVALVSLGVNDGGAPDLANYQTIVRALHGIGARAVWIEPPAAVNAPNVRGVIASLGVQVIPAMAMAMAPDGLHPASYRPWAQAIAQAIA